MCIFSCMFSNDDDDDVHLTKRKIYAKNKYYRKRKKKLSNTFDRFGFCNLYFLCR